MPKIFFSYRHADSAYATDSIYTLLVGHFGKNNVFLDVGSIPVGVDFRDYLRDQIAAYDVVLVVIGPEWARLMQERAAQPNDFVRIEIENALAQNKLVIPVLVMNATMPDFSTLPPSIQELQWRNTATVRRQPDLESDCARLAEGIQKHPAARQPPETESAPSAPTYPVEAAIQRARAFKGKRNRDWEPYITTFPDIPIPDMPFCLVPVGAFNMGSDDGHYNNELPVHPQIINQPYWIAQHPVTNIEWKHAVVAKAVKPPYDTGHAMKWYNDPAMSAAPVVGVDWFLAGDFAAWMGCRLPTEVEWEYAARGIESLRYPWGHHWNSDIPVWDQNSGGKPATVMTHPEGKSWVGAYHLSGSIWEWMSSLYLPYDSQGDREVDTGKRIDIRRVLRGGSWKDGLSTSLRASRRAGSFPGSGIDSSGFRIARSIE